MKLTDIKVLSLPKKLGTSPWRENWIFDVCGVVKAYALEFTPTPNGTQMASKVP